MNRRRKVTYNNVNTFAELRTGRVGTPRAWERQQGWVDTGDRPKTNNIIVELIGGVGSASQASVQAATLAHLFRRLVERVVSKLTAAGQAKHPNNP